MKVCIYGAGVIGGLLASAIQEGGHEVSVIARGAHLAAIKEGGLIIRYSDGHVRTEPRATDDPRELGPQDLVIVATKTPSLPAVARGIGPLVDKNTLVAFAVNGIFWFYGDGFHPKGLKLNTERLDPGGALHSAVGAERALGVVCVSGGEIREPGVVEASRRDGLFIFGAAISDTLRTAEARLSELKPASINLKVVDNIREAMWSKYLSVVGNFATCALTGGTIGQVQGDPTTRSVQLNLMAEAHEVALAHGFDQLGSVIERARANPARTDHKPSMLQDLERGRVMEIDTSYLILQDLASQLQISTPTLDTVTPLLVMRSRVAGCYPGGS